MKYFNLNISVKIRIPYIAIVTIIGIAGIVGFLASFSVDARVGRQGGRCNGVHIRWWRIGLFAEPSFQKFKHILK
jgi:hypothetical protein